MGKNNTQNKEQAIRLADSDSYLPFLKEAILPKLQKRMPADHTANILALMADLLITHYDSISEAYEANNGLDIQFKARLSPEKDDLTIQFKPVNEFKDSASMTVPDPNQDEFDFDGSKKSEPDEEEETPGENEPLAIEDTPKEALEIECTTEEEGEENE